MSFIDEILQGWNRNGWDGVAGYFGRQVTGVLHDAGLSDGDINQLLYDSQNLPVIGNLIKASEGHQSANEYLRNRGMSWEDVTNVLNLPGGGDFGALFNIAKEGVNFVSDNVKRLYE